MRVNIFLNGVEPQVGGIVEWSAGCKFMVISLERKDNTTFRSDSRGVTFVFGNWNLVGEELPGFQVDPMFISNFERGNVAVIPEGYDSKKESTL